MHVPRRIYPYIKGIIKTPYINYNQSRVRPAFQDPDDKSEGILSSFKRARDRSKRLYPSYIKTLQWTL